VGNKDDAMHRCILAAQLGHIAMKEERNMYKAAGNREVTVFPGSNLYERREKNSKGKPGQDKGRQPPWIVAGEIVHTSQLFVRTIAKIDPNWIADLGAHLCTHKYSEPHWNLKSGRVLVTQRTLIHGLEVKRQHIDFLKVDAVAATQMFIRAALIDSQEVPITLRFYAHNNQLRQKIETMLTRVRSNRVYAIEERLFRFYDERIKNVSSIHDLNRFVKEHLDEQPNFLCATEEELTAGEDFECDLQQFPDKVALGNTALPVTYNYKPGEESDGVTVQVPAQLAGHLTSGQVQWMVPGNREELANVMLRALPKVIRRQLMPIDPKAREIAAAFDPGRHDFLTALADFITRRYRIHVRAEDWPPQSLPAHLQPRVEVLDPKNNSVIAASRDLDAIRSSVQKQDVRSDAWEKLLPRVERFALRSWSFGDLPETILVEELNGTPILGYLGLVLREGEIDVRLFRTQAEAARGTPAAIRMLAENTLAKDLAWLPKELRSISAPASKPQQPASFQAALSQLATPAASAPASNLSAQAHEHILAHMLRLQPVFPLTEKRFFKLCETVRRDLPAVTHRVKTLFTQIHDQRAKLLTLTKRYPGLEQDLARLIPADLLATTPHDQLQHLTRYLKAIQVRNERWLANPAKDAEKNLFITDFDGWPSHVPKSQHETFRWMMEEYRVQVFAQELGTAQPVSVKRLEALWV
jgi:ATP-dependent helicase HrpA